MTKIYIYGLREVGEIEIRYVGQSVDPHSRCKLHMRDTGMLETNLKRLWIEDVIRRNVKVEYVILEECSSCDEAVIRENFWIDHYRETGHRLTNTHRAIKSVAGYGLIQQEKYRLRRAEYLKKRANGEVEYYDDDYLD